MKRYFWPFGYSLVTELTPEQCCGRLQRHVRPWNNLAAVQGTVSTSGFTIARRHNWGADLPIPSGASYPVIASGSFAPAAHGTLISVRFSSSWLRLAVPPAVLATAGFLIMASAAPPHGMPAGGWLIVALLFGALAFGIFAVSTYLLYCWIAGIHTDGLRRLLHDALGAEAVR